MKVQQFSKIIVLLFICLLIFSCKKEISEKKYLYGFDGKLINYYNLPVKNYTIKVLNNNGLLQSVNSDTTAYFNFNFETSDTTNLKLVMDSDTNYVSCSLNIPYGMVHLGDVVLKQKYQYEIDGTLLDANSHDPEPDIYLTIGQWDTDGFASWFVSYYHCVTDSTGFFHVKLSTILDGLAINYVTPAFHNSITPGVTHLGIQYWYFKK